MMYSATKQRGFTLVEALVYISGLILVLGGMVAFLYYVYDWYRVAMASSRADQVGIYMVNQIDGDMRAANKVNLSESSFGVALGAVSVTSQIGTNSTTTRYYLSGGRIASQINGGTATFVSPSDLTVSAFYVNQATTSVSTAVRFEIDVAYRTRQGTTTTAYTGLGILRQSYQ